MNIVFAKHKGNSKAFAFEVPNDMVPHLKKDMEVLVDTRVGLSMAVTTTNVVSGDGAYDVAAQNGASFPLKSVVSFVSKEMMAAIREQVKAELLKKLHSMLTSAGNDGLPW